MRPLKDKGSATDLSSDLVGHVFEDRYQIERQLGRGGIGVVYYATDTKLEGRPVAVKVLSEMMGLRQSQRRRFEREAKALAALNHPNVVSVIDYGVADNRPYLVMELLQGEPLSQVLADDGPLEWERTLKLMTQMLRGLCYVHERSIAHRDLKPGNLFVQTLPGMGEHVKLLDFGFAKFLDPSEEGGTLTRSGEVFGTPGYMPPEQLLGKPVDTRGDVYSTCVMLYEMLAGRRPYVGDNLADILKRQLSGEVPRLVDAETGREAHPALEALLARGMAVDVEARFRNARELTDALLSLPEHCVKVQSEKERKQQHRAKHEAATRKEAASALATVANAAVRAPQPAGDNRKVRSAAQPGVVARALSGLVALCASVLRAGAVVLSLLSLLVIVGAGVLIYVSSRPELAHTREALRKVLPGSLAPSAQNVAVATAHEAKEAQVEPSGQKPASVEPAAHVPARDPWRGALPPVLRSARALVAQHRSAGEKTLNTLRRYNAEHPDDARGHLLLGGLYMNRGWFSDGVQQYQLAFRTDASTRGDTRARADLLSLAEQPEEVWAASRTLLSSTYGAELREPADQAAKRTRDPVARERLLALASEASAMPAQRKEQ